jgi:hypothetical protein
MSKYGILVTTGTMGINSQIRTFNVAEINDTTVTVYLTFRSTQKLASEMQPIGK